MELYDNGSLFFFSKRFSHFSALIHIPIHMTHEAGVEAAAPQAWNLSIWNNGIPFLSDGTTIYLILIYSYCDSLPIFKKQSIFLCGVLCIKRTYATGNRPPAGSMTNFIDE